MKHFWIDLQTPRLARHEVVELTVFVHNGLRKFAEVGDTNGIVTEFPKMFFAAFGPDYVVNFLDEEGCPCDPKNEDKVIIQVCQKERVLH